MSKSSGRVKKWRSKTKEVIVESMGGKCQCCNYDVIHSLDCHHINADGKEFSISCAMANPKNWKSIVMELRKCVLVCANCHREIHAGVRNLPEKFCSFNENFKDFDRIKRKIIEYDFCPVCGKEKDSSNVTCSYKCAGSLGGKVDWKSIDIISLFEKNDKNYTRTGTILGVSDNSVRKRLKKIGYLLG